MGSGQEYLNTKIFRNRGMRGGECVCMCCEWLRDLRGGFLYMGLECNYASDLRCLQTSKESPYFEKPTQQSESIRGEKLTFFPLSSYLYVLLRSEKGKEDDWLLMKMHENWRPSDAYKRWSEVQSEVNFSRWKGMWLVDVLQVHLLAYLLLALFAIMFEHWSRQCIWIQINFVWHSQRKLFLSLPLSISLSNHPPPTP